MNRVSFEDLHREHMEWLSEINFWREEIRTMRILCKKNSINKNVPAKIYHADILNQLDHHERLLNNMESQIYSHENFLKEIILSNMYENISDGMSDHDHNRKHMKNFGKSIKKLKQRLYREHKTP
jgi:hypothetical protein